jgi:MerR family transcriptional regulator, copper efflux regulator
MGDESADAATHQIGEVAELVGLSLRTIRHYEEVGLVPPSARSAGGFRLYTDADIERLRLVKHMKPLDFALDEMRDLLRIRDLLGSADIEDREALVERLGMYAAVAEERCVQLRERLANAEAFAVLLRGEAATRGRS